MTNIEKLNGVFCEIFSVEPSQLNEGFDKCSVDGWDSVKQLSVTSNLEDEFDIMLDPEDIIGCTSYIKAIEILRKYEIEI